MSRSSPSQDGRPAVLRLVEVVEPGIAWDKPFLQMHLQLDRPLSHDFGKKALELLVVRQAKQRHGLPRSASPFVFTDRGVSRDSTPGKLFTRVAALNRCGRPATLTPRLSRCQLMTACLRP